MKIVIVGAGSVGFHLAENLSAHNHDVVLIDRDTERSTYAANRLDCLVVNDEGNNPDTLKKAGVEDADFFLSVTNSDEVNMIACFLVSAVYQKPVKIARVRNVAYAETRVMRHMLMGIDFLANPEVEAARAIADAAVHGATGDVRRFERTEFQLRSVLVGRKTFFKNKSIQSIRKKLREDFLIAGIFRENDVVIPSGNTIIRENDRLQLVATRDALERIFIKTGAITKKLNNILLVGGGRLGRYVIDHLMPTGRKIKVIEADYPTCQRVSDQFPDAMVIYGNISDETIYEEEQLQKNDLIITTTGNQELNILSGIYAKTRGVQRSIATVHSANYLPMAVSLGIDVPISPKISSVDAILKFIRRGNIKTVHSIFDGQAEVIEYTVDASSPMQDKALKDIPMPENSLIVAVNRDNKDIIPDGRFVVKNKDNIIAFTKKESVEKLEETFSG
jgi:trk system potassium uptake protein TrkA